MTVTIKKILAVVLAAVIVFVFAGCSGKEENEASSTKAITTDNAVIKEADAVNLIKTYTAAELGLEGKLEDYKIMVGKSGEKVDGNYYIKVIASKVSEPDSNGSVTIDTYGEYFISYDGKTILVYDKANDVYNPLADIHEIPQTTAVQNNNGDAQ